VRVTNNLAQWIKFFLVAIIETSKRGKETFQDILKLKEKIDNEKIVTLGKKIPNANLLVNMLYSNPVFNSSDVIENLKVTPATANSLIEDFMRLGILEEITGGKRYRIFMFREYLNLFTQG